MNHVIALFGQAGSGKSIAAAALEDIGYKRVRFSGPMKDMLRAFFRACGLSEVEIERRIEGDLKEAPDNLLNGKTPRYAMQTLGTEWGRALIGENIWSSAWLNRAIVEIQNRNKVVAEDVRFKDEEDVVRALDGRMVNVEGKYKVIASASHASENMEQLTADLVVKNDKSIEDFQNFIKSTFGYQAAVSK